MAVGAALKSIMKAMPLKEVERMLKARSTKPTKPSQEWLKKTQPKARKPSPKTSKGAKLVEGAGDMSDPKVGQFREGQKQRRAGATNVATEGMSAKEKEKLARQEAAMRSLERAKKLKKGSLAQLEDEYDKLIPSAKRAERLKGSKSKFIKVFKARGMAELSSPKKKPYTYEEHKKANTKQYQAKLRADAKRKAKPKSILKGYKETKRKYSDIIDFKEGGQIKGKPVNGIKGTKVAKADGWSSLSEAEKAAILGLTTRGAGGIRKHSKKKTKKPTKVRKANRGGMTGEGLYPAEEARSGTMSQARRKKYMKKGGKITYRMTGGQVVDAGYD